MCAWHLIVSIAVETCMKCGGRDDCGGKKAWKHLQVVWKHTVVATLKVNSCLNKELLFFPFGTVFPCTFLALSAGNIHPSGITRIDVKNYSGLKVFEVMAGHFELFDFLSPPAP